MTVVDTQQFWMHQTVDRLRKRVAFLEEENQFLKNALTKPDKHIPKHVKVWMREYDFSWWDAFWCYEHDDWFTVLDNSFPYHWEGNSCEKCEHE